MKYSPILVVAGEPNSIFTEIYFKSLDSIKVKKPIILISSEKLIRLQMLKLKIKRKIKLINYKKLSEYKLDNNYINLIDIKYNQKKAFEKISFKSKEFIENCFQLAFKIIREKKIKYFINGPISKKYFLKNRYLGITEYIAKNFNKKKFCMLIYNKYLSVSPVTTHLPIKLVAKRIRKQNIEDKIILIQDFYKKILNRSPRIGILGLNPHCESILNFNEDEKIIKPLIDQLKRKKLKVTGPVSADTAFLKKNRKNYDVIIGMYHDQVLAPIKTIYEYDAINITLGLPFIRISPDHGPNEKMMGKNLSNPFSLIQAIKFLDTH